MNLCVSAILCFGMYILNGLGDIIKDINEHQIELCDRIYKDERYGVSNETKIICSKYGF